MIYINCTIAKQPPSNSLALRQCKRLVGGNLPLKYLISGCFVKGRVYSKSPEGGYNGFVRKIKDREPE